MPTDQSPPGQSKPNHSSLARPANGPVIDVRGLTKTFGDKTVVKGLDMRVEQGEIYGFLGPNGSGKTTFIRMLCGLLTPDGGSGTCLGYDIVTENARVKPHIGYMTQRFSLYEDLTVRENLLFIGRIYQVPDLGKAVDARIARMGLDRYEHQLAGRLSGGWKQRLALAACTLHSPRLLLLDEPTAGVDPGARRDFWDEVHRLAAEGVTALISTHYMDEAERCHRLAYIAYGDLLAKGTAEELIGQSGLTTYAVSGPGLSPLGEMLGQLPGVDQVAVFGANLHVSGRDAAALERAVTPFMREPYLIRRIPTTLEEVFINLMQRAKKA
jgi:ABC-2 type transport system ATP-binding protein